jgi:hypothetical protein
MLIYLFLNPSTVEVLQPPRAKASQKWTVLILSPSTFTTRSEDFRATSPRAEPSKVDGLSKNMSTLSDVWGHTKWKFGVRGATMWV